MRWLVVGLLAGALALVACASDVYAHPNHVSVAEARWNASSKHLEVALKLHPNDLESALRQRFRRRVVLETTPDVDRLIQRYLAEVFVVTASGQKPARLKWVGKEISVKAGWLYFEVPLPAGPRTVTFSNRILFELLSDQVNLINLRVGSQRKSVNLSRERPARKVKLELEAAGT